MIIAERLSIGYGKDTAKEKILYRDMDFSVPSGSLTCLIGPNGAGKSTLLRTLAGIQEPVSGKLSVAGTDMKSATKRELSRKIGLVLTDRTVSGGLTVEETVSLGRYPYTGFWGRLSNEDRKTVAEAMEKTGITDKKDRYMSELSDGERQKVMIAKAIAQECPVIFLDEPTAFLDVTSRIEIMYMLKEMADEGRTVLMSTHEIEQVLQTADNLMVLDRRTGLRCGSPEDLACSGCIEEVFGGSISSFDIRTGMFRQKELASRRIRIEAGPEMMHWGINVAERCGYREDPDSCICMTVESATEISIKKTNDADACTFTSFSSLAEYLRNH